MGVREVGTGGRAANPREGWIRGTARTIEGAPLGWSRLPRAATARACTRPTHDTARQRCLLTPRCGTSPASRARPPAAPLCARKLADTNCRGSPRPYDDRPLLLEACRLAQSCAPVPTAYNVGCVIADAAGRVVARGFSRELPGNTHAEEVALARLPPALAAAPAGLTLYTSMEPCSERLSGRPPCAGRILAAGVRRVVLAVAEPPTFVAACTGARALADAGVDVLVLDDAECRALALGANAHLHLGGSGR
jgi:diaminohydroxyphosphoribosylaminopyrimidine deaminase / 5-amino-6-(5-phosphoribosylamino)uracil reductase